MSLFNIVFHVVCLSMFGIGAVISGGELNYGAVISTAGLVLLGAAYTGLLGSTLALFNKKD